MQRTALRMLAVACVLAPAMAGAQVVNNGPKAATYITDEEVKAVNALPGVDRQIVSVDVGKTNVQVGIIHRVAAPARGGGAGAGAAAGGGAARGAGAGAGAGGAAATAQPCGEAMTPAPADAAGGGIYHDGQTETYIIVSGTGTLVTGGKIINGRKSPPESEVTKGTEWSVVQRRDRRLGRRAPQGENWRHHRDSGRRAARLDGHHRPR